jgi:predicted transcriptional regulator
MGRLAVHEALEVLRDVARRHGEVQAELAVLARRRDDLVRRLSADGLTRREVADAAGLTPARVQQIVDHDDDDRSARVARMAALQRATAIRTARAALRRKIAAGEHSVVDVLEDVPEEAASMTVGDLLASQRGWGAARVRRFLQASVVPERKTVAALSNRQRRDIASRLGRKRFT